MLNDLLAIVREGRALTPEERKTISNLSAEEKTILMNKEGISFFPSLKSSM